jgi:hypothetical protein
VALVAADLVGGSLPRRCAVTRAELIASVERMQDELAGLRALVVQPTAPLSMGDRAEATETIRTAAASLGNLGRTQRRGLAADGGLQ